MASASYSPHAEIDAPDQAGGPGQPGTNGLALRVKPEGMTLGGGTALSAAYFFYCRFAQASATAFSALVASSWPL